MPEKSPSRFMLSIVAVAILVAVPVAYLGTFVLTVQRRDGAKEVARIYRTTWQATLFKPAEALESWIVGKPVTGWIEVGGPGPVQEFHNIISDDVETD